MGAAIRWNLLPEDRTGNDGGDQFPDNREDVDRPEIQYLQRTPSFLRLARADYKRRSPADYDQR